MNAGGEERRSRPADPDGDPVDLADLAAVQADDHLLEFFLRAADAALIARLRGHLDTDCELARVLAAWRRDVDVEPVGDLVDPETAVTVVRAGWAARRLAMPEPRRSWRGPVAAVLALLVIAASWLGVLALDAQPGDWLWWLHELLYSKDGVK